MSTVIPPATIIRKKTFCTILLMFTFFLKVSAVDNDLSPEQMKWVDSLMGTYHIEYCCDTTANECIEKKPKCTIAPHLYEFASWMTGINAPPKNIIEQLNTRYEGFTTTKTADIDTSSLPSAGNPKAPVVIFVYASANCPTCKKTVGQLYHEVRFGQLDGKARLLVKPNGGGIGNIALYAAAAEGTFWKLFTALKKKHGTIKEESELLHFADSIGIATDGFKKRLKDPATKKLLAASREEAEVNEVKYIPEFYINGKRYRSSEYPYWVVDAALFEYEKLKKRK